MYIAHGYGIACKHLHFCICKSLEKEKNIPRQITTLVSKHKCNCITVGKVPLQWYKNDEHIGYGQDGSKLIKKKGAGKDKLD